MIAFPLILNRIKKRCIHIYIYAEGRDWRENDSARSTMAWYRSGRGCFPRAVAPKVSPSKISMIIRSCTGRPRRPTYVHELQNIVTRRDTAARRSSPVGFRPVWNNVTRIFDGLVCLRPVPRHPYPIRRARLWNDRLDWSKACEIVPPLIRYIPRFLFFIFLESRVFDSRQREREREEYFIRRKIVRILVDKFTDEYLILSLYEPLYFLQAFNSLRFYLTLVSSLLQLIYFRWGYHIYVCIASRSWFVF